MKDLIYGKNTVLDCAYDTNRIIHVYIEREDSKLMELSKTKGFKVTKKPKEFFQLIKGTHQGYAAEIKEFAYKEMEYLKQLGANSSILILDQIQDPHNFGAIIRTAVAANFDAIIIAKTNQVGVTPAVEKTAVGTTSRIVIIKTANIASAIELIQKNGFWVVGTGLESSKDYRTIDYTGKIALVVGSEGKGMRRLVFEKCDHIARIPMNANVESLNVSVATAIMCFHIHGVKNPVK